jgi:calcineurin-like phosphoesterase family protein
MGFAYTGFPKGLEGGFIVNYDSFSIDYLEKYISSKKLIAYIVNNFSYKDLNERVLLSLTGYLNGRFSLIFPYQKKILKNEIINYFNINMDSSYQTSVRDLAFLLGVNPSDLDKASFIKALRIEDESLVHNYAASFILYPKDNMDNTEKDILLDYMKQSWAQSQDLFYKKIITENYLNMNKLAGDMFLFYADYLLADEKNSISNRFGSGGMGGQIATADINHLDKVEELLLYSTKKEDSERRDAISRMALESYKLIAQRATDKSELELVINSMKNIHTHGHDFILSYIREVENAFAERMYKPLSLDEVLEL